MIEAARQAVQDMMSPDFRKILWKSLGLTVLLFLIVMIMVEAALSFFAHLPWHWLETALAWLAGLGIFAAFLLLMAPVTALFAGFFLDEVAGLVERHDYPGDPPGREAPFLVSLWMGVETGLFMLVASLLLLPFWFLAMGPLVMVAVNAWLLSREFFLMIASRHMPMRQAKRLRKQHGLWLWLVGLIPSLLTHVPVLNLFVPLFATAYFVHIFKKATRFSSLPPDADTSPASG